MSVLALSITCGDSSPSRGALGKEVSLQRKGELAGLSAMPKPPLLGEVALRSNDGEVVQSRSLIWEMRWLPLWGSWREAPERVRMPPESLHAAIGTSLGQSDPIAVSMALTLPGSPSPSALTERVSQAKSEP